MNQLRILLGLILVGAVLSVVVAWFLPVPPQLLGSPEEFRATFGVANFTNVLSIGTAMLFLVGLTGFKQELKRAYYLICAGLLTQTLGTLIYSALSFVQPVSRNLVGDLPITLGSFLIFLGVWRVARALRIQGVSMQPVFIVAYLVLASAILWVVPHPTAGWEDAANQANHALEALFYPIGTILLWKIVRTVSPTYARSFRWMLAALAGNFIAAAVFMGKNYAAYPAWASDALLGLLFIIDTLVYVAAGYSFATIEQRLARRKKANSTVDIIIFVAGLASQPKEVDPMLDRLRVITARGAQGHALTSDQENDLASIYLQLEDYLTTKDPLRTFTANDIRRRVLHTFERLPVGITPEDTDTYRL